MSSGKAWTLQRRHGRCRAGQRRRPSCTQSLGSEARTSWLPGEESEWSSLSQVSPKVHTPVEELKERGKQEQPLGIAEQRERGLRLELDINTRKDIFCTCTTFVSEFQPSIHCREFEPGMACINTSIDCVMCNDVRRPKTLI